MTISRRGRRSACAAVFAVSALAAVPATSLADGSETYTSPASQSIFVNGPTVKKFRFTGNGYSAASAGKGSQAFSFSNFSLNRNAGGAQETHSRSERLGKVKLAKNVSSGTWKGSMKKIFSVNLRFRATKKGKSFIGKGCKGGKSVTRPGVVSGSLKVDMGSYFKTIRIKRAKGSATRSPKLTCTYDPDGGGNFQQPVALYVSGAQQSNFSASRLKGVVTQSMYVMQNGVQRSLFSKSKAASALVVADDAKTASVAAASGFSGSLNYTADSFYEGGSNGSVTGDLVANFATGKVAAVSGTAFGNLNKPGFVPPPPPNEAPVANFDGYQTYDVEGEVQFSDFSYDNDGNVVARSWDFGDGTSSTDVNPKHTYPGPGTYTVKLTVTDDRGSSTTSTQTITVEPLA